ncbi:MAG: zinc-binding alcohol dehydrogenase family protein [Acidimicrobiales bacterium]
MKAAVYYENGPPSVFRYEEVPDPVPGPGEMLVRVEVVSIEGGDTLNRLGGPLVSVPHIVGYQNAGVVLSVGPDVTGFAVGDRVVGLAFHGSHAELRVAHPLTTWKIPDGLATELAACVPVAYGTAHDGLFEFGRLVEGETALIHAGAGGVGLAAIQMAKAAGARVIATASSDERLERLREFGLDDGINYREKDFVTEVRALTNNRGADVILDSVGGENLQKSLTALAYRGRCVTFGNAGRGEEMKLDTSTLGGSNQSLIGYFLGPELFVGSRAHAMIADLLDDVAAGDLRVEIDRRFALADAEEAHAFIESRQAFGRVILLTE